MTDDDVIEGEVLELEESLVLAEAQSTELVKSSHAVNLFGSDDPITVIERATAIAKALADVIERQGLYTVIQGRKHVNVEGWTMLGSMLGVFPIVEWSRELPDGWEARVVAKTRDGDEVGSAEAMCVRAERTWKTRDAYAIRSMAQTRATAKALRLPLGFVMTLGGYEATPVEEIPEGSTATPAVPVEPEKFDPANMLRSDAPSKKSGWKGIIAVFEEVDPSIQWPAVIGQAVLAVYGNSDPRKLEDPARSESAFRAANAAGRLSELFMEETFLSLESIQKAFAEMFDGVVVEVPEFEAKGILEEGDG